MYGQGPGTCLSAMFLNKKTFQSLSLWPFLSLVLIDKYPLLAYSFLFLTLNQIRNSIYDHGIQCKNPVFIFFFVSFFPVLEMYLWHKFITKKRMAMISCLKNKVKYLVSSLPSPPLLSLFLATLKKIKPITKKMLIR